mgnify:CR=1 FL=1|tara:strand:- start:273 stop:452 length:180 start_codon:yes stop_codon:yes gene_type:complete
MKKTMFRLAQPAATTLLALSIFSIPAQIKAYGDKIEIKGKVDAWIYQPKSERVFRVREF